MLYHVKPVSGMYKFDEGFNPDSLNQLCDALDVAEILDYPWLNEYPVHFHAEAMVGISDEGLNLLMWAKESPILAKETRFGGMPCMDSCLEFFLMPFPEISKDYINIEINPIGTAHVGVGEGRPNRRVYRDKIEGLIIDTYKADEIWAISCLIPNSLFIENFGSAPKQGDQMKANFYKCSGPDLHEHYGTWNHVIAPKPDFHRPECFGDLIID